MIIKSRQGQIQITENIDRDGILITLDDDQFEQQAKGNFTLEAAKLLRDELGRLIDKIEGKT